MNLQIFAVLFLLFPVSIVHAQISEIRSCQSVASDPDDDGFGWEWDREQARYASCEITDTSSSKPSYVNRQTGLGVELIRAFWNGNRDIAEQHPVCENHSFRDASLNYELVKTFNFSHERLPNVSPFIGAASYDVEWSLWEKYLPDAAAWTVVNGIYNGPLPINSWVEIVDRGGVAGSAVRSWTGSGNYYECFDEDGTSFQPTGFVGEVFPEPTVQILPTITAKGTLDSAGDPIINLETGVEVIIVPVLWDMYQDLYGREIACQITAWDGQQYESGPFDFYKFYPIYNSSSPYTGVVTQFGSNGAYLYNRKWTIDEGRFVEENNSRVYDLFKFENVEMVVNEFSQRSRVRMWVNSEGYYECQDRGRVVGVSTVDTNDGRDLVPGGLDLSNNSDDTGDSSSPGNADAEGTENIDSTTSVVSSGGGSIGFPVLYIFTIYLVCISRTQRRGW